MEMRLAEADGSQDVLRVVNCQLPVSVWITEELLTRGRAVALHDFENEERIFNAQITIAIHISSDGSWDCIFCLYGFECLHLPGCLYSDEERSDDAAESESDG